MDSRDENNYQGGFTTRTASVNTSFPLSTRPCLSIVVHESKKSVMCRILKPFVKHFSLLGQVVEIADPETFLVPPPKDGTQPRVPPYTVSHHQMSAPAIAVMLFLPEFGPNRAERVKTKFLRPPWHLHHSIQLQNQKNSNVIGQQDFYCLSRRYPLWCVCTGNQMSRRLRVKVFVRRYAAMVEFYRLVTETEMESSKQGFCIFSLDTHINNSVSASSSLLSLSTSSSRSSLATNDTMGEMWSMNDADVSLELALKHCPSINPFPLSDVHLILPVRNLVALKSVLHTPVKPLTSIHHLVHDPDGNPVVLLDTSVSRNSTPHVYRNPPVYCNNTGQTYQSAEGLFTMSRTCNVGDKTSLGHESHDSGRFSDTDISSWSVTELDICMAQLFPGERSIKNPHLSDRQFNLCDHGNRSQYSASCSGHRSHSTDDISSPKRIIRPNMLQ